MLTETMLFIHEPVYNGSQFQQSVICVSVVHHTLCSSRQVNLLTSKTISLVLYVDVFIVCTRQQSCLHVHSMGKRKKEKNIDKSHTAAMLETLLINTHTQNKVIKHHFRYATLSFYIYNHSYKMFDRFWFDKVMLRHSFKINNGYRHPRKILHFKEYSFSQLPSFFLFF